MIEPTRKKKAREKSGRIETPKSRARRVFLSVLHELAREPVESEFVTLAEEQNRRRLLPLISQNVRRLTSWGSVRSLHVAAAVYHRKLGAELAPGKRPEAGQLAIVQTAWHDVIRGKVAARHKLDPDEVAIAKTLRETDLRR